MDEFNIQLALEKVGDYGGVEISVGTLDKNQGLCASLNCKQFVVLYRNSITTQNIDKTRVQVAELKKKFHMPVLVITTSVSANVMETLFKEGISVAETSGNCRISNGEIFISISGNKKNGAQRTPQTYTDTKLKVIFYLLLDKENVSQSFRHISDKTGVSLAVIKQTIDDLINKKFIILTPKGRILKNRRALIELWSLHYNQIMKPKLLLARYDFAKAEDRANWKDLALPQGLMWGGEPAENIIDGYIKPELFEIYTQESVVKLLSSGKFKPNPNGKVSVYRKFWIGYDNNTVPDVLIYADLMGVGDSRCKEGAEKLLNIMKNW